MKLCHVSCYMFVVSTAWLSNHLCYANNQSIPTLSNKELTFQYDLCLYNESTNGLKMSLLQASAQGTKLVVIANYFKGCQGGRVEAAGYSRVQQDIEQAYPGKAVFFTNLVDGTGDTCRYWSNFVNALDPFTNTGTVANNVSLHIFGDVRSERLMSHTFFDNNHPQYMVIDGLFRPHYFSSRSQNNRTDCALAVYGWEGYEPCTVYGYDLVANQIPGLIDTLNVNGGITNEDPPTLPDAINNLHENNITCAIGLGMANSPEVVTFDSEYLSHPTDLQWKQK